MYANHMQQKLYIVIYISMDGSFVKTLINLYTSQIVRSASNDLLNSHGRNLTSLLYAFTEVAVLERCCKIVLATSNNLLNFPSINQISPLCSQHVNKEIAVLEMYASHMWEEWHIEILYLSLQWSISKIYHFPEVLHIEMTFSAGC